jgi:predicted RNase H-like HicB family nuclease
MTPEEYLKRPYQFCLIWDEESRTWTGTVKEFSGCISQGDTWNIVFKLRRAAIDWIAAALDLVQAIPEPENKHWRKP